ncbi:MAG: PIN domain-containing protein [Deltaproteobacteria bacterium]|nr:PIN domain-containing protein [Deltaproteobacteria bacterium]
MLYVLDTHPVVWFVEGSPRLSAPAKAAMSDPSAELIIPTIVLVEIEFLYAKKRARVDVAAVRRDLITASNSVVYPLDEHVVSQISTSLNIHDAIIVATALGHRDVLKQPVAVVTKDAQIAQWGGIQTIW